MQNRNLIHLFLCGDVMLGRGIDQILPFPLSPVIHESSIQRASDYVKLAEKTNGPIPKTVDFEYIWGAALDELQAENPDVRIINLETAVTSSSRWMPKGINYRMNPYNTPILRTAQVDVAVLANNHVLDWKEKGLLETIESVKRENIQTVGAGFNLEEASRPALIHLPQGASVQVFAFALESSGVPEQWAATEMKAGVNFIKDLSMGSYRKVRDFISENKDANSVVILSLHWGDNWGFEISEQERRFAEGLIDEGLVDVIYGHSSHHPKAIQVYKEKLILYGCGDFINDYEGIRGYEDYRADLVLMYFPKLDSQRKNLQDLRMVPLRLKNFHLVRPQPEEMDWLLRILSRESQKFNTHISLDPDGKSFQLQWAGDEVSASLEARNCLDSSGLC